MTHYYFSKGKLYEIDRMPPVPIGYDLKPEQEFIIDYLSTLQPINCEGFTQEGVYPEDRIEWEERLVPNASNSASIKKVAVLKEPELNTSDNWYHKTYPKGELVIMDPDGWDRANWYQSWYVDMITKEEFERRVAMSTVMMQAIKPPSPSVDSPEPTAGDGWKYDYKFLKELTKRVNDIEHGEGLSMEEVESVLLAINFQSTLPKTDKDAAMTPQSIVDENFKGLDDAIGNSELSEWYKRLIVTCLEGYGSHCVTQYKSETENEQPQLPKTDEDAANIYSGCNYAKAPLQTISDAEYTMDVSRLSFLAGCQHVRGQQHEEIVTLRQTIKLQHELMVTAESRGVEKGVQQGDAVALCDCELSEKCKAGIYKQSEREPCKKIIQLIAEEIKNTWSEVYNKRWSANPKEGTAGEIDYVPFVKNFMPRLYDLFTSRPGDLQQGEGDPNEEKIREFLREERVIRKTWQDEFTNVIIRYLKWAKNKQL